MSKICLISIPRTGSNHLCRTIRNFSSIASAYEIFNNEGAFGLNDLDINFLNKKLNMDFKSNRDKSLIGFFKDNPIEVIDLLHDSAKQQGKQHFVFKIFPKQLPDDKFDKMIADSDINFSFIVRKCMDSYISYKKASEKNVWHSETTTDMLITAEYEDFKNWYDENKSWYTECEKKLIQGSKAYSFIAYERDIDCPHKKLLTSFRLNMRAIGIDIGEVYKIDMKGFTKQDRKEKIGDKISNWKEFKAILQDKGMFFKALDYFL